MRRESRLARVERVEIDASADDGAFDAYVMVEWSSSSSSATGNDSIWIASGAWSGRAFTAGSPHNISTRVQAVADLQYANQACDLVRRDIPVPRAVSRVGG